MTPATQRVCRAAALAMCFVGCDDGQAVNDFRERVDPPAAYGDFWAQTEACSMGRSRDFGGVAWFWASQFPDAPETVGQWNPRREITIHRSYRFNRGVVMHEILHDLLNGDGNHADPAWDVCGVPVGSG